MNKIIKICVFLFVGCLFSACHSNDDEMVVNAEDGFTQADIANLKAMKQQMQEATEEIAVPMQRAIRRSRATTGEDELTEEETAVLRSRLKLAGTQTVASFNNLGISTAELNDMYRIDGNEELYGMVGISLVNGMELVDFDGSTQVMFDSKKALECLGVAFGIDVPTITAIVTVSFGGQLVKCITKAQLKKLMISTIKEIGKALLKRVVNSVCIGSATDAAIIFAKWVFRYFDWNDRLF